MPKFEITLFHHSHVLLLKCFAKDLAILKFPCKKELFFIFKDRYQMTNFRSWNVNDDDEDDDDVEDDDNGDDGDAKDRC